MIDIDEFVKERCPNETGKGTQGQNYGSGYFSHACGHVAPVSSTHLDVYKRQDCGSLLCCHVSICAF